MVRTGFWYPLLNHLNDPLMLLFANYIDEMKVIKETSDYMFLYPSVPSDFVHSTYMYMEGEQFRIS